MGDLKQVKKEVLQCIIPRSEPKALFEKFKESHPDIEVRYLERDFGATKPDLPKDFFKDVTILYTLGVFPPSLDDAPHLRLVHLFSAGTDRLIELPLFKDTDIIFTNSSGVHGPQISEWVIMTALVHKHGYLRNWESQKKRTWDRTGSNDVSDLVHQRLGVLGYGAIGRQTARVASAMGMEVYAYTATKKETPEERRDHGYIVPGIPGDADGTIPTKWFSGADKESLHNFLSQDIDILVVSVPLTPATRHLLSTAEFEVMAKHPPLISNIARGPILDQAALVTALHKGQVAAATLDVTDPEPLPSDDPLWNAPNVIITPHISGATTAYTERSFDILVQNLARIEKGAEILNKISRRKGY